MTWSDRADDDQCRVDGTRDHARNINAFTVASADRQWFFMPGTKPPIGSGRLLPLSPALVPGYGFQAAAASERRARTSAFAHAKHGRDVSDREIQIVTGNG